MSGAERGRAGGTVGAAAGVIRPMLTVSVSSDSAARRSAVSLLFFWTEKCIEQCGGCR